MRIWELPEVLTEDICQPALTLSPGGHRVEVVKWNPAVADILALSFANTVKIFDVSQQKDLYGNIS